MKTTPVQRSGLLRPILLGVLVLGASTAALRGQPFRLDDIVEIRGYHPPPDVDSPSPKRDDPKPVDLKGAELKAFLKDYVYVRNEDVKANAFSGSDSKAVFKDGERKVTFAYAVCPGEVGSIGLVRGKPHQIIFFVQTDAVIFELKDLCKKAKADGSSKR